MRNAIAAVFISAAVLVPAFASAHSSSPKPPKDTTPPTITSIHIESNNASTTRAKAGDTVTITFTTSEPIKAPAVLVETRQLFVKALNTTGNTWSASYTVNSKDPLGRVDYLFMIADTSNNVWGCSSVHLPLIKYCPTTDGSSVTIYKDTTPPPPPPADTTPPVIAAHADVFATTSETSAEVSYVTPTATDNVSGSVSVTCVPPSGTAFAVGTTTVECGAQDSAGNAATSTFSVVVTQILPPPPPPEPTPYTMAGQTDESYLCGVDNASWRYCDLNGTFSFTDAVGVGVKTIDLGIGSGLGTGTLQTVTIAKDPNYGAINGFHPWPVTISCRVSSSANAAACSDWSTISDTVHLNPSGDGVHWVADFSSLNRTFVQGEYYTLTIDDTNWETPVYGSQSLQAPYWLITGLR